MGGVFKLSGENNVALIARSVGPTASKELLGPVTFKTGLIHGVMLRNNHVHERVHLMVNVAELRVGGFGMGLNFLIQAIETLLGVMDETPIGPISGVAKKPLEEAVNVFPIIPHHLSEY